MAPLREQLAQRVRCPRIVSLEYELPARRQQLGAATMDPGAAGLAVHAQQLAQVGDGVATGRDRLLGALDLADAAPDPGLQLTDRGRGLPLGGTVRQDDLHAAMVDGDPNAARAL
jgi:hypothetical protein